MFDEKVVAQFRYINHESIISWIMLSITGYLSFVKIFLNLIIIQLIHLLIYKKIRLLFVKTRQEK